MIAGLAIVGSLLAGLLVARGRSERQWNAARQRAIALDAADRLLAGWWAEPGSLPVEDEGAVEGLSQMRWRTRPVANEQVRSLGGQVVRLDVFHTAAPQTVLASVEVVVPERPAAANPHD